MGQSVLIRWASYLAYGLVLTFTLLIIRFPVDLFLKFTEGKLNEMTPAIEWKLSRLSYVFPKSIRFDSVGLSGKDKSKDIAVKITDVVVAPRILSLFKQYNVDAEVFAGVLTTRLTIDEGNKGVSFQDVSIKTLQLDKIGFIKNKLNREVTGQLSCTGNFEYKINFSTGLNGNFECSVNDGQMSLMRPILGLDRLKFNTTRATFFIESNTIVLKNGKVIAPELNVDFFGDFLRDNSVDRWNVQLKGEIGLKPELLKNNPSITRPVKNLQKQYGKTALPFVISGTVDEPKFGFGK